MEDDQLSFNENDITNINPHNFHSPDQSFNVDEIDSGQAMKDMLFKYTIRIKHLKSEVSAYKKETDNVVDENLIKNLELLSWNKNLEIKVKERTHELEIANDKLRELSHTKEALMHMIVHDMKNPLTAMLGTLIFFTRNDFGVKPEMHQLLKDAHGNGIKLLSMIEQILMISRMQTNEFELKPADHDIISLIYDSIDLMSRTMGDNPKHITFSFAPSQEQLLVHMDTQIIDRVLNNLLNNAIKYAPRNSEINVSLMITKASAVVSISNWGDPIPEKYHRRVFELFCRVKKEDTQLSGTGLGLTFCKLAVEAHGGTIYVTSPIAPKDHGTRFTFSIPLETIDTAEKDFPSEHPNEIG